MRHRSRGGKAGPEQVPAGVTVRHARPAKACSAFVRHRVMIAPIGGNAQGRGS
jgi:hypothetical protein